MPRRASLLYPTLILFATFAVSPVVLGGSDEDGGGYYYSYFRTPAPLTLDPQQIAVFVEDDARSSELPALLSAYGVAADSVTPFSAVGWSTAEAPADAQTAAGIEALVGRLAADPSFDFASPVFLDERGLPLRIARDLLVGFHGSIRPEDAEALLASSGAGMILERDFGGLASTYRVRSGSRDGFVVLAMANMLAALPEVEFAEPDMIITAVHTLTPNDTYFSSLWGIKNTGQSGGTPDMDIDGDEAWDITTGDPDVIIVVFDEGIQQDHPDLNQIAGKDFTGRNQEGGGPYNDCDNHGTCVAGCITAIINNERGVVGVAPECVVASAKIGEDNCDGSFSSSPTWLVNALNWSHQTLGARVSNSSFAYVTNSSVTNAYKKARDAGVIHFAATGNNGREGVVYPASLSTVEACGSVDRDGNRSSFSNYGSQIDFSAPGESIRTTDRTGSDGYGSGDYVWVDGTSFASPYSAGVGALILSMNIDLTPDQVKDLMIAGCVDRGSDGWDKYYGNGLVNSNNSIIQPGAFNLVSPLDGADGVKVNATFEWTASDNAETYTLTIDDDADFLSPVLVLSGLTDTSVTLDDSPLEENKTYYWGVVAVRYEHWQRESTPASRSFITSPDCNGNGVSDENDIANGTSQDCNSNGIPDECDTDGSFYDESPQLSPIGDGSPQNYTLVAPPDAIGDVTLTFRAVADLNLSSESIAVSLNGTWVGDVFLDTGSDCPDTPDEEAVVVDAATFNALKSGGDVQIEMDASVAVNKDACTPPSWISVAVSYEGEPPFQDQNDNGVPDECEQLYERGDVNCDGSVDFDDIDPFVFALVDPDGYAQSYPDCDITLADINQDGSVDFDDIDPFVVCLTNGGCP